MVGRWPVRAAAATLRGGARVRQIEALRARAVPDEVSVAELVRRAVEAWISSQDRKRRALQIVGRFGSGHDDVAGRHDEHLVEAFRS